MTRCYLLSDQHPPLVGFGGNGGGNVISAQAIAVRRFAAIGDSLAATIVADKLSERGYQCRWITHPMIHCIIRRHPHIESVTEFAHADVDLDGAYEKDPVRRVRHFSEIFLEKANQQLVRYGINLGEPLNCRPRIRMTYAERCIGRARLMQYEKPWVFICPRSDTYACRQVPDGIWQEAAKRIRGTKFWLGRHPAPAGIVDLKCQHLDNLMMWLSAGDLLISVDTGPLHLAAAMGIPILALGQSSSPDLHLSDQVDFLTIQPNLTCLNCQHNLCPINAAQPPCQQFNPEFIAQWANARLRMLDPQSISAVVPTYRPPAERLNRCLTALLPQVQEIIVTCEAGAIIPANVLKHPKIRYVRSRLRDIGYGRNVNFGARQSNGHWIWIVNDDCYVEPDAAARLMECARPGVGLIGHLLFYPDGSIQHGGKFRQPGMRGWGHIDQRKTTPSIQHPVEMENVTGASILVNRQAFYEIDGNDESFHMYAVDDAMCLSMKQAGYKVMFTPHAKAIHEEAATGRGDQRMRDWVIQGNTAFDRKWGWWITQNINTVPGVFP
jgi:GT2 family glycosyltransferase/ADP-heptose:LPS heptosyltransferase